MTLNADGTYKLAHRRSGQRHGAREAAGHLNEIIEKVNGLFEAAS